MGEARDSKTTLLVMRSSRGRIGIPLTHVVETMRPLPSTAFSGSAGYVRGVAIIRGKPVPVVSIERLLGGTGPDEQPDEGRLVLTEFADRQVALTVAGVDGVARLEDATLQDCPSLLSESGTPSRLIASLAVLDGDFFAVLNSACLVPDEEWAALSDQGLLP